MKDVNWKGRLRKELWEFLTAALMAVSAVAFLVLAILLITHFFVS